MIGFLRPVGADAAQRVAQSAALCGLCHHLGDHHGFVWRIFATPDLVFYNLFLDLLGDGVPGPGRRSCVLAPGVTRLPVRPDDENTQIAADFGVWMAVAKLEDDVHDDGGWLRWWTWRALKPGADAAQHRLRSIGFPVDRVLGWMAEQARIEAAGAVPLEHAARPTSEIAALTFGFAARHRDADTQARATAIGAAIGRYLFYMDNLLDYGKDVRNGSYNALARASTLPCPPGACTTGVLPELALDAGLRGAYAEVHTLDGLLDGLEVRGERAWLKRVLVHGFRDKLLRFERLPAAIRVGATLRMVEPPRGLVIRLREMWRGSASQQLQAVWSRARKRLGFGVAQLQATLVLLVVGLMPRSAWAERWWPQSPEALEIDTGTTLEEAEAAARLAESAPLAQAGDVHNAVGDGEGCWFTWDACFANCGFFDCTGCCEGVCGTSDCGDCCATTA